jgi:aminoglycoside 3-N-acetyltransferase
MNPASRIASLIRAHGSGPVFVHSDPFRTARLVERVRNAEAYVDSHIALLIEAAGPRLWLPSFNYDFPKSHVFDVRQSGSQLGPIPERFRLRAAEWRTDVPMFSFAGMGAATMPDWGDLTDPFGAESMFAQLVNNDGVVLFYGETFHYSTLVHHAERVMGGPVYRYDKIFPGSVVMADGTSVAGSLMCHVRPLGSGLDYDWPRLLSEAIDAGVCTRMEGNPEVLAANARRLCDLWISEMRHDPLALLDEKTRSWAEPALDELGRRFIISDFESPEPIYQ